MTQVSVRDEYAPRFGRQVLTLWSGGFASDSEGSALELPGHDGFMVTLDYGRGRCRVECETPRDADNYERVDGALDAAVRAILAGQVTAPECTCTRSDVPALHSFGCPINYADTYTLTLVGA